MENFIADRRVMLKVKSKSLAEESRIIRREERKLGGPCALRAELHRHRIIDVREESRATHLAYGIVRGMAVDRIEKSTTRTDHLWGKVRTMVKKYGPPNSTALLELCKNQPEK